MPSPSINLMELQFTSTSWLFTGPSVNRAKDQSWCGAICSTFAACLVFVELSSCVKNSLFPFTRSLASRCRAPVRSQWGLWPSLRCSTRSEAMPSCGVTVAVDDGHSPDESLKPLCLAKWIRRHEQNPEVCGGPAVCYTNVSIEDQVCRKMKLWTSSVCCSEDFINANRIKEQINCFL